MRDNGREERSGRGRHRGVWKNDQDLLNEAKAKGNYNGISHEPGLAHTQDKLEDGERMRHQRGDGGNQKHESPKKTPHQSRSAGAERAESNEQGGSFSP